MKYKIELEGLDRDIVTVYEDCNGKWRPYRLYNLCRDGSGHVKMNEAIQGLSNVICGDGKLRLTAINYVYDLDGKNIVLSGGLPSLISLISNAYGLI